MSRFANEEAALAEAGKCSHQTEYGNGRGEKYCGDKSAKGAQDGNCDDHEQERKDGAY
jgi:hypothetical protein